MKCDIIIPVWNQFEFTKDCLEHIAKNTSYPYRLIVIDNASDEATRGYLENVKRSYAAGMELIRNGENAGFIKAVNQGLEKSSAPYVCILNNDTVPAPGWLERMIDFAETHNDVGLINPQCDGHGQMSIDEYAKKLTQNKGIYMEMNQCQGFAMLIKREVIDKIGYLDEEFGIGGFDDTDYSMRAHKAGYKSVATYDAYVYHRLHASFDKAGNREEWVRRNRKLYYEKWGKHLRLGISVRSADSDPKAASDLVKFIYALAREWAWTYVWVNCDTDEMSVREAIEAAIKRSGYPMHQNLRIKYHKMPRPIFDIMIWSKAAERVLNPRMRDKRFDATIVFRRDPGVGDWEKKGREFALELRSKRKN